MANLKSEIWNLRFRAERGWIVLLAIVALGFLLRCYFIFGYGAATAPELFEYHDLAQNLLYRKGYLYSYHGTPYWSFYSGVFYIGITAALYTVVPPGYTAVLVAQAFFSALLAVVIFLIGRKLWSERAGLLAAFLTISHPGLLYYDTHKLHPLSFDSLTGSLAVLALLCVRAPKGSGVLTPRLPTPFLLAGVALGAAILQRGSLLLLFPLGLLWLWFFGLKDRPFRPAAAYFFGVLLVLTPWVARNYQIHGVPLLLTTTGEHFWLGNAPHSYGSNLLPSGRTVLDAAPEELRGKLLSRDEWGQDMLFWEYGLQHVWDRPWNFLLGVARKFVNFWTFAPQSGILYPPSYIYVYTVYYFAVAALGIVGAVRLARVPATETPAFPGLLLILALFLSVSAIQSLFYVELRHRWAIEPMLLVLSSVGVVTADRKDSSPWGYHRYGINNPD